MVDFIVSEADEAAKYLPLAHTTTETGRATKGAAIMLKAKTYLWAASKVFQNKGEELTYLGFADDQSHIMLEKAKKAYEDLFALNQYSLIPISATTQDDIRDAYRKIFLTKNSQESIFEVQHSDDGDFANKFGHKLDRDAASPSYQVRQQPTLLPRTMWTSMACSLARPTMHSIHTTTETIVSMPTSCMMDVPTATT